MKKRVKTSLIILLIIILSVSIFIYNNFKKPEGKILPSAEENVSKLGYKGYIIEFKDEPAIKTYVSLKNQKRASSAISKAVEVRKTELRAKRENIKKAIETKLNRKPKVLGEYENVFNGIALDINDKEADKIKKLSNIKAVYPNYEVYTMLMDSVPLINADDVWNLGYNGSGIKIAVIDTGIDYTHPDLNGFCPLGGYCGDKYCNASKEDKFSCPQDCEESLELGWPAKINNLQYTPVIENIDDDLEKEIIIYSTNQEWLEDEEHNRLFVFNHDGTKVQGFPKSITGFSSGVPAVEDIDNDGKKEILLANYNRLHVFKNNGSYKEGFPKSIGYTYATPAVGDINNDGKKEIIVGTGLHPLSSYGNGMIYVFNSSGSILWSKSLGEDFRVVSSSPVLGDINGDEKEEIVHGATTSSKISKIYAWNDDGTLVSGFPVQLQNDVGITDILSKVVLADSDNDGKKEIFVVSYQNKVYGIKGDGSYMQGWPKSFGNRLFTNLVFSDVDNNSKKELVFASYAYGTGGKEIFAVNLDGTNVIGWPKISPYPPYSFNIEDINYDNIKDIIIAYTGKTYAIEQTGSSIDGWPKGGGGNSPAQVSDIDNDNNIEIVVPSTGLYDFLVYEQKIQELGGTENNFIETTECKVIQGYDFVNNDNNPIDDNGHGTHVAGISAGSGAGGLKGIAYDAKLYAYKVLDSSGSGTFANVISGIERAIDPNLDGNFDDKADIISMSLGGSGNPDDAISKAVDNAVDSGVVAVIAAGNSGPSSQTIKSPGTARKAITVGATYKKNYLGVYWNDVDPKVDQITSFSSRGPVVWANASGNFNITKPDVVAPGAIICSSQYDSAWNDRKCLDDKHVQISGTSMATPMVSGAVALIKQAHPDWSPEEIKMNLKNTAKNLGYDINIQGAGRIDVLNALDYGAPSDTTPPTFTNIAANQSYVISRQLINFSVTVTDDKEVDRVWFSHNFDLTNIENQNQTRENSNYAFGKTTKRGQQIKFSQNVYAYEACVRLKYNKAARKDVLASLWTTNAQGYPANQLANFTISNNTITSSLQTYCNNFTRTVYLTANTIYTIILESPQSSSTSTYYTRGQSKGNYYANGMLITSTNSGSSWTSTTAADLNFTVRAGLFDWKNESNILVNAVSGNISQVKKLFWASTYLPEGVFNYKWCANDSSNNEDCSLTQKLPVS